MRPSSALIDIIVALALFILASVAAAGVAAYLNEALRMPVVVVVQGLLLIAIVGALLARRRQSWRDIGLVPPTVRDGPRMLLAYAGCLGANMLFIYTLYGVSPEIIEAHTERLALIAQQLAAGLPLPVLVAVLLFVGVYEEIFARGLLLARCRALMGGTWAPVLVSSLLFGLGHLYQGWIGVGQTTIIGIVLALVVIRWGSLWPAILAHALLDISSILFMSAVE
jgi:uncharacterized protein